MRRDLRCLLFFYFVTTQFATCILFPIFAYAAHLIEILDGFNFGSPLQELRDVRVNKLMIHLLCSKTYAIWAVYSESKSLLCKKKINK